MVKGRAGVRGGGSELFLEKREIFVAAALGEDGRVTIMLEDGETCTVGRLPQFAFNELGIFV